MKKSFYIRRALLVVFAGLAVRGAAQDAKEYVKPEAFPEVELSAGSAPRYTCVSIDPWDVQKVAYLLFDGTLESGYTLAYIWVPGDRNYGTPVALKADQEQNFPPQEFRVASPEAGVAGGKEALISWTFRYRRRSHGGTRRRFNYATGTWSETSSEVTYSPAVFFSCGYGLGPRDGSSRALAQMPLSLNIPGESSIVDDWSKLPNPVRPWEHLHFTMERKVQRKVGQADVHFSPQLQYRSGNSWRNVGMLAIPPTATATLTVSPYLEDPIIDEEIPASEMFPDGKTLTLPYAWYEYKWGMECEGISINPRLPDWPPHALGPDELE